MEIYYEKNDKLNNNLFITENIIMSGTLLVKMRDIIYDDYDNVKRVEKFFDDHWKSGKKRGKPKVGRTYKARYSYSTYSNGKKLVVINISETIGKPNSNIIELVLDLNAINSYNDNRFKKGDYIFVKIIDDNNLNSTSNSGENDESENRFSSYFEDQKVHRMGENDLTRIVKKIIREDVLKNNNVNEGPLNQVRSKINKDEGLANLD